MLNGKHCGFVNSQVELEHFLYVVGVRFDLYQTHEWIVMTTLASSLVSAVFVLRPPKAFGGEKFLGRAAHKLFLLMLTKAGELSGRQEYVKLSNELHKLDAALPFTVSDLFTDNATHFWMRITGLDVRMSAALDVMAQVLPRRAEVDGWNVDFGLLSQHDWAAQTTYEDFVRDHWKYPAKHRLTLEFITPTAIKSAGVSRPFPDPALVFRLLYERLLKLDGLRLPFTPDVTSLETFAQYYVEIADYEINCVEVEMKGPTKAFCGAVTYRVLETNDAFEKRARTRRDKHGDGSLIAAWEDIHLNHGQYARLLNLLAHFAFFSGVGSKTGQGMGMVRLLEDR